MSDPEVVHQVLERAGVLETGLDDADMHGVPDRPELGQPG
jgi:hypothetical protein